MLTRAGPESGIQVRRAETFPTRGGAHQVPERTGQLRQLVSAGNSVIVVEHNTDVMVNSDWMIDVGPESASAGGKIVAEGTPQQIATNSHSMTGVYLNFGNSGRCFP